MRGRRSELIEVDGSTWFPRDIEEALCGVPGVRQAALIGVPSRSAGLRPRAFVTLDGSRALDGAALKSAIMGRTPYDLSLLTVETVAELPMTPTGKISKAELAARYAAAE
jgi:acyl-coenzyme A synthetase/AMP-(fatty) acid ligase